MTDSTGCVSLPPVLREATAGYDPTRDELGRSSAGVFRLEVEGRQVLYLKTEVRGVFGELAGEAERLVWLRRQGLPCPEIILYERDGERDWLLMSALAGADLVSNAALSPVQRVCILAEALRRLHAVDIGRCPFDHRLDARIDVAKARTSAGYVDESDFDDMRRGRRASGLLAELEIGRPVVEDLVITHGDACLPNFAADGDGFTGYLDCGCLGIADRYQDIALACWSITYNFGPELVRSFLEFYGIAEADPVKMAYCRLLDEFF